MSKKVLILVAVALALSTLVLVGVRAQPPDRPHGIPQEHWLPVSPELGLQVATPDLRVERPGARALRGTMWAKHGGAWHPVYLEAPAHVLPARP